MIENPPAVPVVRDNPASAVADREVTDAGWKVLRNITPVSPSFCVWNTTLDGRVTVSVINAVPSADVVPVNTVFTVPSVVPATGAIKTP